MCVSNVSSLALCYPHNGVNNYVKPRQTSYLHIYLSLCLPLLPSAPTLEIITVVLKGRTFSSFGEKKTTYY